MKGYLLLVLLVATGVAAQTDKTPDKKTEAEPAAAAAKKHVKTETVKAQKATPAKNQPRSLPRAVPFPRAQGETPGCIG